MAQKPRKLSTYLLMQYNNTLYDYTEPNNPWGVGLGLQAFLNNKTKFKPTIELTADAYLEDDKVFRANPDGTWPVEDNTVPTMVNFFGGLAYCPANYFYLSCTAGPSFIAGQTFFGIKPTLGFYFSNTQKCTLKLSYINVFNRTKLNSGDFGSFSMALGLKLF